MTYIPISGAGTANISFESFTARPVTTFLQYPSALIDLACVNLGNFIYTFGGSTTTFVNQTTSYRYSITNNTYSAIASLPAAQSGGLIEVVGTNIYLIYSSVAYRYDTVANSYSTIASPPATSLSGTSIGQYIYAANSATLYRYDTVANTWTTLGSLPVNTATYIISNDGTNVYLFGQNNSYRYVVASNTYTSLASFASMGGFGWLYSGWSISITGTPKPLYVSNSGSFRSRNKFFIHVRSSESQSSQNSTTSGILVYDVALNTMSRLASEALSQAPRSISSCGVQNSEFIYSFTSYFVNSGNFILYSSKIYTPPLSSYTAEYGGLLSVYSTNVNSTNRIINETTGLVSGYDIYANSAYVSEGSTSGYAAAIPVKAGDIINDLDNRGNQWGGTPSSPIELMLINGETVLNQSQPSTQSSNIIEVLVVAGGGGGGSTASVNTYRGAGGGGGGVIIAAVSVSTSDAFSVTIGGGGAAHTQGSTTSFGSISASGGGGGQGTFTGGTSGGSGGGASEIILYAGTDGQGSNGGYGTGFTTGMGGGGGAGSDGNIHNGGSGIRFLRAHYGGGGASGNGTGGIGGGANGPGTGAGNGNNGTANTGGGGSGSFNDAGAARTGGSGGSGIVIVAYPGPARATGGTISSEGGFTFHRFTAVGSASTFTWTG